MVRPRADGTGWFTTLKPERTYKTEKGAYQAQRLFENPSMQIQNKWQLIKVGDHEVQHQPEPELQPEPIPESSSAYETVYVYKDPSTNKKYVIKNDSTYKWDDLDPNWKRKINEVGSDYETKNELINNGWIDVHLSSFFEDAQDKYPSCPWTFEDILKNLANDGDVSEIVEEQSE